MNDRFKFRAWDKVSKKMNYNNFVVTATGFIGKIKEEFLGQCVFRQDDMTADNTCMLMQCTGLKDKNRKLIYEGDILQDGVGNIFEVSFIKYCYYVHEIKRHHWMKLDEGYTSYEIIGNIYETPELLEKNND